MESCFITPLSLTVHQLDLLIPWESQYWNRYVKYAVQLRFGLHISHRLAVYVLNMHIGHHGACIMVLS